MKIVVGGRGSHLSRAQVKEVEQELKRFHPEISFSPMWIETQGDRDLSTELSSMEKTPFFTKEIDNYVMEGVCHVGIHSAKDLPEPLAEGLCVIALTKGIDPADVLVLRDGDSLQSLPMHARIGTSSPRREKAIRELRSDFVCVPIRGEIERRLLLLDRGDVDGVVMAEAALIRLRLTHRSRFRLAGPVAENQGKLAVVARRENEEMRRYFACIDTSG